MCVLWIIFSQRTWHAEKTQNNDLETKRRCEIAMEGNRKSLFIEQSQLLESSAKNIWIQMLHWTTVPT